MGSILLGCISFILFLKFYKRLKPGRLWGKSGPASTWGLFHMMLGLLLLIIITLPKIYKLPIALLYALTGCIMVFLGEKSYKNKEK
jgi:hypothetical protein